MSRAVDVEEVGVGQIIRSLVVHANDLNSSEGLSRYVMWSDSALKGWLAQTMCRMYWIWNFLVKDLTKVCLNSCLCIE